MKNLLTAIFCCSVISSAAQFSFEPSDEIPVKHDSSQYLKFPWVGGFNNPQFSSIDLNLDGIMDLLVFDRNGNKLSSFIQSVVIDTIDLEYDEAITDHLPSIENWMLAIDYNCDQNADIFTYGEVGIKVYTNTSTTSMLRFSSFKNGAKLKSNYGSGKVNLLVSGNDIPAISDIDLDGDIDILTFSFFGGDLIEYHKNQSMELYGHCDSLEFVLVNNCWGNIMENTNTNAVTLGISCKGGSSNMVQSERHIGSTLTAIDLENDNDKDLLIGDISFKKLTLLVNGGDSLNANITSQDADFPSADVSVDIDVFPAAFYFDINKDNRKDLFVAPNSRGTEDIECSWLYLDEGSGQAADFNLKSKTFLVDEMIDMGTATFPASFDYNTDQIPDLIVGNGYAYNDSLNSGRIDVYLNTGTLANPEFEIFLKDIASISGYNWRYVCPTFGDLDGDMDIDMIVGEESGLIHYFENLNGPGNEPLFVLNDTFFSNIIDVGSFATPSLFDLNNDNLPDLVIGESNGRLNYYRNTGNQQGAEFTFVSNFLGEVDVSGAQSNGYSFPNLFSWEGITYLVVGSEDGQLFLYDNIDNNLDGGFNLLSNDLLNRNIGNRTTPLFWNFNNDNIPDLMSGNFSGGLNLLKGLLFNSHAELVNYRGIKVYPNPFHSSLYIEGDIEEVSIYNINGNRLVKIGYSNSPLDLSDLPPGIYIIQCTGSEFRTNQRIIKMP